MRPLIAALSLTLLAPAAFADTPPAEQAQPQPAPVYRPLGAPNPQPAPAPAPDTTVVIVQKPTLIPIVLEDTAARCRPMIKRTTVPSLAQQLPARIALASCIADA